MVSVADGVVAGDEDGDAAVGTYIRTLGDEVARQLARRPTPGPGRLVDAAVSALHTHSPAGRLEAGRLLRYAARCTALPERQSAADDTFGQPPLVLYWHDEFFVQILTWIDGTTDIHQHAFEGAFAVADGMSLHVPYGFERADTVAEGHVVTGTLSMSEPEVLRPGDVRPIDAGPAFIHALFHLQRPSVSVVVRDKSTDDRKPQFSYTRPGLGWDKLWSDRRTTRRRQSAGALATLDPGAGRQLVREVVVEASIWTAFLFVVDAVGRLGWTDEVADLCEVLVRREPALRDHLTPALRTGVQENLVLARRGLLREPHQRTFLALLANLPEPAKVERVVAALYPGSDAGQLIVQWITELASPKYRAASGVRLSDEQLRSLADRLGPGRAGDRAAPPGNDDGSVLGRALAELAGDWEAPAVLRSLVAPAAEGAAG